LVNFLIMPPPTNLFNPFKIGNALKAIHEVSMNVNSKLIIDCDHLITISNKVFATWILI
jgi:hypothetical protein